MEAQGQEEGQLYGGRGMERAVRGHAEHLGMFALEGTTGSKA